MGKRSRSWEVLHSRDLEGESLVCLVCVCDLVKSYEILCGAYRLEVLSVALIIPRIS